MVTDVAVMPGADAWLLVDPPLVLLLPQAATSAVATPVHAAIIHRLGLGCRRVIGLPPLSVDTGDVW